MHRLYRVLDPGATQLGAAKVEDGCVYMTDAEAEHWLRMGVIEIIQE